MAIRREVHERNRLSWNAATRAHNTHKRDQAAFLAAGGSTLFPEEVGLLGDVAGKELVHLQCNAGQDTLSLARLGARVTGVDISDEAVAFARALARDASIDARFERADVYDWLEAAAAAGTDVVFSSYGALGWLTDLDAWAAGIARLLRPRGTLVLVEFHPVISVLDPAPPGSPCPVMLAYPYSSAGAVLTFPGVDDYVALAGGALSPSGHVDEAERFVNPHPCEEVMWGLAEIVSAVLGAGLALEALCEYPYSNGSKPFPFMRDLGQGRFALPESVPSLPLMFGLRARRH